MSGLRTAIRAAALAGPFAVAFASGGFFAGGRLPALIGVAALLGLGALASGREDWGALRDRRAVLALGALAAYCGWVAVTATWSPREDLAAADVERWLLYLGALALAAGLWRSRPAARAVEPALAAGVLVVCGYALAGRLLPGIVHLDGSRFAGARLFQPLGYWNGLGMLAALGFVLCARVAGDRTRPSGLRGLAAAAAVPIGGALYLTFSRGALVALLSGLIVLLALAPTWTQLRAIALTGEAAGAVAVVFALLPGVNDLGGSREADGAIGLVLMMVLMILAAATAAWARRVEDEERTRLGRLPLPGRVGLIGGILAVAVMAAPVLAGSSHGPTPKFGQTTSRLLETGSNRYQYWKVAGRAFLQHPAGGIGTGGFTVEWMRRRTITERVTDAHSWYLETLAELGVVGFLLLLALLGAIAAAARAVYRLDPALAAGPIAALSAFGLHAGIDWDLELPALTLVAIALAGLLLSRLRTDPGRTAG